MISCSRREPSAKEELTPSELEALAARVAELLEPKIKTLLAEALRPVLEAQAPLAAESAEEQNAGAEGAAAQGKATWKEWTKRHWRSYNVAQIAKQEEEILAEEDLIHGRRVFSGSVAEVVEGPEASTYDALGQDGPDVEATSSRQSLRPGRPQFTRGNSRKALDLAANYRRRALSEDNCCSSFFKEKERIVNSDWFEHLVGMLVLLNAVAIGVETDFQARTGEGPPGSRWISLLFAVCFSLELVLRIAVNPFRYFDYHHTDRFLWHLFDLLVVPFQLIEALDGDGNFLSEFGLLRICRVFRILRLVRVVRFFAELRMLVSSMISSVESLCWALMLLFGIVLTFATAFCQIATDTGWKTAHADELRKWFGDMGWSTLTLLQCITGGTSWSEIITVLIHEVGIFSGTLLVLYIGLCLFAVTNAVTGVFVTKITSVAVQDKVAFLTHQLREIFFEKRKDDIEVEMFEAKLDEEPMQNFFKTIDVDPNECKAFFSLLDIDGSHKCSVDELVNGCVRLTGPAQALDLAVVMRQNTEILRLLNAKGSPVPFV